MSGSKPQFTEAEAHRLQQKVLSKKDKKTGDKETPGLYDKVDVLEGRIRKLKEEVKGHETRMDNIMVRLLKLELGIKPVNLTQTVVLKKKGTG